MTVRLAGQEDPADMVLIEAKGGSEPAPRMVSETTVGSRWPSVNAAFGSVSERGSASMIMSHAYRSVISSNGRITFQLSPPAAAQFPVIRGLLNMTAALPSGR